MHYLPPVGIVDRRASLSQGTRELDKEGAVMVLVLYINSTEDGTVPAQCAYLGGPHRYSHPRSRIKLQDNYPLNGEGPNGTQEGFN